MVDRVGEAIGQQFGSYQLFPSSGYVDVIERLPIHNLPAQLTSLVGRDQEIAAVCDLLLQPQVRILTLTGMGGVGKTRLVLQVATELIDDFNDGVCFVALASVSDSDLVVPTIAQTLGIKELGARPLADLLQAFLRGKHMLLLLDNFEQVVVAAPQLSELAAECPHLKILVTSRVVLHIRGEHEFPVPPLALPDLKHPPDYETLSQYAAVVLFIQRARATRPNFELTPANAHTLATICTRLDGLPLAIELAAARIKLLPLNLLLARLEDRLSVLTGTSRDVPARQQTLRNTIAWSYHLLDVPEQRLFRHLSVFANGCTLAAAEAICAAPGDGELSVLDGVASLIDKSLLQQTEQEAGEPRFVMLETIREYGLECLAANGEMEAVRHAHAAYYLALAEKAGPEFGAAWLEQLEREHDNLRAALSWSLEQAASAEAVQRIEMALRLSAALQRFWMIRGYVSEGRTFLTRALAKSQEVEGVVPSARANALKAAARLALAQGDYDRGETLATQSLALCRELGDTAGIAFSLYLQGIVAWRKGNVQAARALTEESLALFREVGDKERIAYSLFQLAYMASNQGEYTRARTLFSETVALHRELENKRGIAHTLCHLAQVLFVSQGDQTKLNTLLEESLALSKELGFKEGIAASFCLSAQVALSKGEIASAHTLVEQGLALYREIEHRHGIAEALLVSGRVAAAEGDYAAARTHYEKSLALAREIGDRLYIASSLEGLATVVAAQGDLAWAVRLWGAAASLRDIVSAPIPPIDRAAYERLLEVVRTQLGEQAFATLLAEGQTMTLEQVLGPQGQAAIPATIPTASATAPSSPLPAKPPVVYPDGLTAREVEVLRLVARGFTDAQVAEQLVISPRTVNAHLTSIYGKIQATSRASATRYAIEHHLA